MIRFYGRKSSDNVQKALWMLLETGQPHEYIELGGKFGGLDDPEFRKINPFAKVPALVDGHTRVWESSAIIRYLAAQYCAGSIWPEDPRERAEADKWMELSPVEAVPGIQPPVLALDPHAGGAAEQGKDRSHERPAQRVSGRSG